jgi:hypothetical protein
VTRRVSLTGKRAVAARVHRLAIRFALSVIAAGGTSCAWPRVVEVSPQGPLFHSSVLVGGRSMDAALCSLGALGPDAASTVAPAEATSAVPVSPAEACGRAWPTSEGQRGRAGLLVEVDTALGPVRGYLYGVARPRGVIVAFSGLGMPAAGWINERFAETAARRSLMTFAVVRDETARPMRFDPLREARRAVAAVERLRTDCALDASRPIGFVGVSMGGLEALLATREATSAHAFEARAAVLDPVLDFAAVASNLDAPWHSFAVDSMQRYFQRLLRGRYGEPPSTSFRTVLARTAPSLGAMTDPAADAPSAWLCRVDPDVYAVLVSDTDPALGDAQRSFARACGFPLLPARAPGHVPLSCRPELFEEMLGRIESE